MLAPILAFLEHYPNFTEQLPPEVWAGLALLALGHTAVSWRVYAQTGLRSYAWVALGGAFFSVGTALLAAAPNVLVVVLVPLPMLLAAFLITSVSDAHAWFTNEGSDKFRLLRSGGLALRLWGGIPAGYAATGRDGGASRRQGLALAGVTLALVGLAAWGVQRAWGLGAMSPQALAAFTVVLCLVGFHATMLGVFAAVLGAEGKRQEGAEEATHLTP